LPQGSSERVDVLASRAHVTQGWRKRGQSTVDVPSSLGLQTPETLPASPAVTVSEAEEKSMSQKPVAESEIPGDSSFVIPPVSLSPSSSTDRRNMYKFQMPTPLLTSDATHEFAAIGLDRESPSGDTDARAASELIRPQPPIEADTAMLQPLYKSRPPVPLDIGKSPKPSGSRSTDVVTYARKHQPASAVALSSAVDTPRDSVSVAGSAVTTQSKRTVPRRHAFEVLLCTGGFLACSQKSVPPDNTHFACSGCISMSLF
jgi:hypothetical protein